MKTSRDLSPSGHYTGLQNRYPVRLPVGEQYGAPAHNGLRTFDLLHAICLASFSALGGAEAGRVSGKILTIHFARHTDNIST